jgi:putative peptide zinc metalloprotease protein
MKDLGPRARRDLEISHQQEGDRAWVVIKDPRTRRFLRLRPPEFWLLEQMDGTRTPAQLEAAFREQFSAALPEGMLLAFMDRLAALDLLVASGQAESADHEHMRIALAAEAREPRGLGRLLFIKLKAVDPDRWLGRLAARLRFLFGYWFWPASLVVIAGALAIVVGNSGQFRFDLTGMLQGGSLALVVLSIFVVVSLHEIAHGVTCRHLGGHVNEMGFLLLYFQPCLYCDLSDAWLFPEKWKKLLVTFAGAYFQILLGAIAVWLWRITAPGTLPGELFRLLAIVSLFNVLFNFNPLIKLDGYYLLSDGLGLPNLRQRAFDFIRHRLLGRAWGYAEYPPVRERRIYWAYGVGAVAYSAALIGYLALVALQFAVARWRGAGLLLYLAVLGVMFRKPLAGAAERILPAAVYRVRKIILWSLAGIALLIAVLVPFEYRVGSPARLEPWAQFTVSVLPDGYIMQQWYDHGEAELGRAQISKLVASGVTTLAIAPAAAVGDSVQPGDTILRITADEFSSQWEEAQAALRAKRAQLELLKSPPKPQAIAEAQARIHEESTLVAQGVQTFERTRSLYDRKLVPKSDLELAETTLRAQEARLESARQSLALLKAPPKREEVDQAEAEVARLERQVSFYQGQLQATVLTCPVRGVVVRLATGEGEVCRIARLDSVRCVLDVDEAYAPEVDSGQHVTLKIPAMPFASYDGLVVRRAPVGDSTAGPSVFRAVAAFHNSGELAAGMSGYAKITTGRRTLAARAIRRLIRFIRIEFWSWW